LIARAINKSSVKRTIDERDHVALVAMFDEDPARVLRFLTRLTYNPSGDTHDAAIEGLRVLSEQRSEQHPDFFREIMRRSLWAMNEEGGNNSWSAPEIIGAVIAGNPHRFGTFFSYNYCAAVEELMFQPSLVKAYQMVADADKGLAAEFAERIATLESELQE
jgi:hypothetical protein